MDGFGMGIDGNNLFFSPVYVELVDDKDKLAKLTDKLDVVPESAEAGKSWRSFGASPSS